MNHKGLNLLFLMQICEGFSFYGTGAILTLFMTQFLNLSLSFAFLIYGTYSGIVYLSTVIGGYLSDEKIGSRHILNMGILGLIIGLLLLSYSASLNVPSVTIHSQFLFNIPEIILIISLICIIIGEGFMRVTISSIVPQLYHQEDNQIDSSFNLLTMALNIGMVSACLILGLTIGEGNLSLYKYGFLILAASSIIAILLYNLLRNKYLLNPHGELIGLKPITKKIIEKKENITLIDEKNNIKIILIIIGISIVFFTGFEVMDSTLMFFAKDYIINTIPFIPFKISPEIIKFIEPFGVIIFTPLIIRYFNKKEINTSISKIILGILSLFLVYLVFFIPCILADTGVTNISILFIIIMELIRSLSEVLFLPISLGLVSKLSPKQYLSRLMGLFYCSLTASYILSGIMAGLYPNSSENIHYLLGIIPIVDFKSFCLIFMIMYLILLIVMYSSKNKIKNMINTNKI